MQFICVQNFDQWRDHARRLLAQQVPPDAVHWTSQPQQPGLFDAEEQQEKPTTKITVPPVFLDLAEKVACHRELIRWEILYRTLWRLTHGERHLLDIPSDDDVLAINKMQKAVTRDVHKMKAFVRFRRVADQQSGETYIAWHRPDHRIVRLAAPFFSRRFKGMNWTILTPDESVAWDQSQLHYGDGVPASEAPDEDELEDLWRTYYASIFNPARVKVAMMKSEMPVRHWPTLPETQIIPDLLKQAPVRVAKMIAETEGFDQTATHFMPSQIDLPSLQQAATRCSACDLHQCATQLVFGVGPADAKIVLIGEQPGDQEDLVGKPFVGPAGQLLDDVLAKAGLDRSELYITNVVKHFKFKMQETPRGKRRLHQKPDSREIYACRPWLEAELAVVAPDAIVCLGATAAQSLLGRDFRITKMRGQPMATDWCQRTIATWHPAAILRMQDSDRQLQMTNQMAADLALAQ